MKSVPHRLTAISTSGPVPMPSRRLAVSSTSMSRVR
jgi:hypothetical protein